MRTATQRLMANGICWAIAVTIFTVATAQGGGSRAMYSWGLLVGQISISMTIWNIAAAREAQLTSDAVAEAVAEAVGEAVGLELARRGGLTLMR